jgi:acyl-CoA thioesterase-2
MRDSVFSKLLQLSPIGSDQYEAAVAPESAGRLFGGQFIAQGMAAAQESVTDDREVHSLHAYFLRPGDVDLPTLFTVDRVRDGRGFSSRMVSASQNGKETFRMLLSFQVPKSGLEYSGVSMPQVPPVEAVETKYADYIHTHRKEEEGAWPGGARPMDILYIDPSEAMTTRPIEDPQYMWMRIREALPESQSIHDAGLAYLSDATLIDHVLLPHGHRWYEPGFAGTSLDHSMWFHHRTQADEWLLFEHRTESTANERGLAFGRFFNQAGVLVASCAQEGLMRWE